MRWPQVGIAVVVCETCSVAKRAVGFGKVLHKGTLRAFVRKHAAHTMQLQGTTGTWYNAHGVSKKPPKWDGSSRLQEARRKQTATRARIERLARESRALVAGQAPAPGPNLRLVKR
ncbi:MAG TPA: hypothetical protein VNV25_25325 [Gemmatimonadaceae bacterium]|jgi:hypothetical protein|nr:hypothetical protein [Gemmatimonadaceae bacterium]